MLTEKVLVIRASRRLDGSTLKLALSHPDEDGGERCFACGQHVRFDYNRHGQEAGDLLFENTSGTWLRAMVRRLNARFLHLDRRPL